jgi:hypothetical protein
MTFYAGPHWEAGIDTMNKGFACVLGDGHCRRK